MARPSVRPPEIIGLGFSVAGGALVSTYPALGRIVIGIGVLLMIWGIVRAGRERKASGKRVVEPSHLIIFGLVAGAACMLAVAAGYAWSLYQKPPAIETASAPFAKNQQLRREEIGNRKGVQPVISYHAEYAITAKHLRAFLEYQGADFGVELKPIRVQLEDFHDFVKNGEFVITVVSRDERPDGQIFFR